MLLESYIWVRGSYHKSDQNYIDVVLTESKKKYDIIEKLSDAMEYLIATKKSCYFDYDKLKVDFALILMI